MELWSKEFYKAINPQVKTVGIDFAKPCYEATYTRESCDYFDIIYVLDGKGKIKIDDNNLQHFPGDIIIIKPGQILKSESSDTETPYREYFVHCYIFERADKLAEKLFTQSCPQKINIKNQSLPQLFENLFEISSISLEDAPLRLKYTMLNIIEIIFYHIRYNPAHNNSAAYAKTLQARDFIEQHFAEKLTIDKIAEQVDISSSYLMAIFKKYFNCSPISYKINQQLNNAKLLLAQNTSVSETAYKTGFESIHYFSRIFHKKTGASPTQFADSCARKKKLKN